LLSASPMPVPSTALRSASSRSKAWNRRSCCRASAPARCRRPPAAPPGSRAWPRSCTRPPGWLYLMALDSRFSSTWRSRVASVYTRPQARRAAPPPSSVTPRSRAIGSTRRRQSPITASTSTGSQLQRQRARLDARQVQHLVDQLQQVAPPRRICHALALQRPRGLGAVALDQLRKAEHRVQRRAQFVRHARQELRLGPVGAFGLVAGRDQAALGRLARGDVPAIGHVAFQPALFVPLRECRCRPPTVRCRRA
jgi:hypothetical protein